MKVIVLGCGLVGGPMAVDLARNQDFDVTVADSDPQALERTASACARIETVRRDLSDPASVTELVADNDLVLNAVPGFMGFRTLESIIEAGRNVVDIAFFPEDPLDLDEAAQRRGVTAIVDCGVAPGMSNLLAAHADSKLDETTSIEIYVGGLPLERRWPFEYQAPFSPIDVIAEYTRPARYVENGTLVVRPALSDPELIDFPRVGTLEAFNTDGLRTLARTLDVPNMKEKTLRYPGHIDKMLVLRESGFFDTSEIDLGGAKVRPIDLTTSLLFPQWQLGEDDVDITVMRVIVDGVRDERPMRYTYDLYDRHDEATRTHSMARTTGYTATTALRLLAAGDYASPGISPPEFLGRNAENVRFMLDGLAARGVVYEETVG